MLLYKYISPSCFILYHTWPLWWCTCPYSEWAFISPLPDERQSRIAEKKLNTEQYERLLLFPHTICLCAYILAQWKRIWLCHAINSLADLHTFFCCIIQADLLSASEMRFAFDRKEPGELHSKQRDLDCKWEREGLHMHAQSGLKSRGELTVHSGEKKKRAHKRVLRYTGSGSLPHSFVAWSVQKLFFKRWAGYAEEKEGGRSIFLWAFTAFLARLMACLCTEEALLIGLYKEAEAACLNVYLKQYKQSRVCPYLRFAWKQRNWGTRLRNLMRQPTNCRTKTRKAAYPTKHPKIEPEDKDAFTPNLCDNIVLNVYIRNLKLGLGCRLVTVL